MQENDEEAACTTFMQDGRVYFLLFSLSMTLIILWDNSIKLIKYCFTPVPF